ncbi:MAG: TatD family hydrolase [Spirochaetota bacterium]
MDDRSLYFPNSVDSHCHLGSLEAKGLDPLVALRDAEAGGMECIVDVGIEPADTEARRERYGASPIVRFTAGLHPTAVRPETVRRDLALLASTLDSPESRDRIVAVGELGLDFYWSDEHRELQIEALERQWDLAADHRLPVVIHNRESEDEMLAALRRKRPRGVMHCFAQGADYCRSCLDLGMHISFGGNLTYKKSEEIRAAAVIVPEDRLLVETDSPYLSPQAVRGRPNHPGHLGYTIEFLAELRSVAPQHIAEVTARNARSLFE